MGDGKPHLTAERLGRVGLFGGLDDETLEALVERVEVQAYVPGDVIYAQGSKGRQMYVVLDGTVEMRRGEELVSEDSVGAWFGEMSVLDMQPRAVSAVCSEAALVLVLTCRDLDWLYRRAPKRYSMFVMNMARQLSRKLRRVI